MIAVTEAAEGRRAREVYERFGYQVETVRYVKAIA